MKFDIDRFINFFNNEKIDQDTKNFVMKFMEGFLDDTYSDDFAVKVLLLDLEFYQIEKKDNEELERDMDYDEEDDYKVIDFYQILKLPTDLRKMILKKIYKKFSENSYVYADSSLYNFLFNDLKVVVPYDKWRKNNRKNKLKNLKNEGSIG